MGQLWGLGPPKDTKLDPPKDTPFTSEQLSQAGFTGSDENTAIYVAVKGTVFDVSSKRELYGPGGAYSVFAGKDASRALGKSSTDPQDVVADVSTLDESQLEVLDKWYTFFSERYNIVGKVV
ncbi:4634_t:CDS:2 [Paraglomus occultum]|uniref:4634_t:CDS:1 n=1 Tax=Paraglomus occultum TaxID=144539 RepID=A0A9N9B055_9GLOM|nr:4634_t:CDS:2 [Paraglomus occultum]